MNEIERYSCMKMPPACCRREAHQPRPAVDGPWGQAKARVERDLYTGLGRPRALPVRGGGYSQGEGVFGALRWSLLYNLRPLRCSSSFLWCLYHCV